jgi:hypothetical protein
MKKAGLILNPNKLIRLRQDGPEAMDIEEVLKNPSAVTKSEKKVYTL